MLLKRLSINADLSDSSLVEALNAMETLGAHKLVVWVGDIKVGERLADGKKLQLCVDPDLPPNAWYVEGRWGGVFSSGA